MEPTLNINKLRFKCFTETIWLVIIILITATTTTYGANTMKAIYSLNRAVMPVLEPKIYNIKKIEMRGLMQIPIDNAVATNRLPDTNAVTLIEFGDTKVKYKTIAKDFKNDVGGGDIVYLPIFSEDTIGYSQTRGFNLLNIKTKKDQYYSIVGNTNYGINLIAVVNPEKRLFLFSVESYSSGNQIFRLMDLSSSEGTTLQEKRIEGPYAWIYADNTIFLRNVADSSLMAMNLKFENVDHPLVHFVNEHKKMFPEFILEAIHPTLPFAIIQYEDNGIDYASVISWDKGYKNFQVHLIFKGNILGGFKFSNDGKWVYFSESLLELKKRDFILMPVDPKLPHYLGKPIYLGEVPDYPRNEAAMTRNPSGLVVVGRTHYGGDFLLIKWDFTKALPLIENGK